jgi:hypothetical protein
MKGKKTIIHHGGGKEKKKSQKNSMFKRFKPKEYNNLNLLKDFNIQFNSAEKSFQKYIEIFEIMYGYSDDYFTGCDYYLVTDNNIGKLRHDEHRKMIKNYIDEQDQTKWYVELDKKVKEYSSKFDNCVEELKKIEYQLSIYIPPRSAFITQPFRRILSAVHGGSLKKRKKRKKNKTNKKKNKKKNNKTKKKKKKGN